MNVTTRSYDVARTGANTHETHLTPAKVGRNVMVKTFSLQFNDDPRLEAQPLYVPNLTMSDGQVHDVVFVCTMANNVWAFSAKDGKPIWKQPTNLGPPVTPKPTPHPGFPNSTEIDLWGVNDKWGILSTPCIDLDTKKLYVVIWTSPDGTVAKAFHELHEVDLASGHDDRKLRIQADAASQTPPGKAPVTLNSTKQKQRAALLLTAPTFGGNVHKTLFAGFSMTHEEGDQSHGWLIAFDLATFRSTAAWCTSPNGTGVGIWQAGQGPAADPSGAIYLMTGNYGVQDQNGSAVPPAAGDLPQSLVKLEYTLSGAGVGSLAPVAWFTPFRDSDRNKNGQDDFQDYDLGSAGPVPIPGLNLVVGAGKDGVVYVLDQDTAKFGQGSEYSRLKRPPIFFTYFPGFGIDASVVANLDHLFDGKTHHLHASPAFWNSPARGPMLFVWGENEMLRAWTIDDSGTIAFVAKSAEVASPGLGGTGGMPGGFVTVSSNGSQPNTGIVWATAPISGDANRHVVDGILRAYDATNLDPHPNSDGTPRLKLLWDSTHIPGNTFKFSKFCPPMVADGKVFVPTYEGKVDVYTLVSPPHKKPLPVNANF